MEFNPCSARAVTSVDKQEMSLLASGFLNDCQLSFQGLWSLVCLQSSEHICSCVLSDIEHKMAGWKCPCLSLSWDPQNQRLLQQEEVFQPAGWPNEANRQRAICPTSCSGSLPPVQHPPSALGKWAATSSPCIPPTHTWASHLLTHGHPTFERWHAILCQSEELHKMDFSNIIILKVIFNAILIKP